MYCIDIGIGEEWYGIASGIISFRNNIVMALRGARWLSGRVSDSGASIGEE